VQKNALEKGNKTAKETPQNTEYLEAIVRSLEELRNNLKSLQQTASGGCPCLLKLKDACGQNDGAGYENPGEGEDGTGGADSQAKNGSDSSSQLLSGGSSAQDVEPISHLRYPEGVEVVIDVEPCGVWQKLYQYWSLHQFLRPQTSVRIQNENWIPLEEAMDAINSVTEAIVHYGDGGFSLWSHQGYDTWRIISQLGQDGTPPEAHQILRRGADDRLLIPFWIPLYDVDDEMLTEEDIINL
jgi:hypothetical protein